MSDLGLEERSCDVGVDESAGATLDIALFLVCMLCGVGGRAVGADCLTLGFRQVVGGVSRDGRQSVDSLGPSVQATVDVQGGLVGRQDCDMGVRLA